MSIYSKYLKKIHPENSEEQNLMIARAFDEIGWMDIDESALFWNVIQYAVKHNQTQENFIAREIFDGVFNHKDEEEIIFKLLEPDYEGGTK